MPWNGRRAGLTLAQGEIVVNSIDADGTKAGYELELTGAIADLVPVPVIASGGAGNPQHLRDVFVESNADARDCRLYHTLTANSQLTTSKPISQMRV